VVLVGFCLSSFSRFVVCGSRRPSASVVSAVRSFCRRLASPSFFLRSVLVGGRCSGVPAFVSAVLCGSSSASSASLPFGSGLVPLGFVGSASGAVSALVPASVAPGSFVARSCSLVARCVASGALWVSFPSSPPPFGLPVSSSWVSCGSGSWSSLSLAVGSGCPALVFSPSGLPSGWSGFSSLGSGWFFCPAVATQLSLF